MQTVAFRHNLPHSVKLTETGHVAADATPEPDDELFIRLAFDADPKRGCELLFRAYYRQIPRPKGAGLVPETEVPRP